MKRGLVTIVFFLSVLGGMVGFSLVALGLVPNWIIWPSLLLGLTAWVLVVTDFIWIHKQGRNP